MNHSWIRKNIIRFIDNDLNENERKGFQEHLSVCGECRKEYDYIRSVVESDIKKFYAPDLLFQKIQNSLEKENSLSIDFVFSYSFRKRYSLVFLLAISILLGTFFGNSFLSGKKMNESNVDLSEEYIPANNNVFTSNFTGNGR